MLTSAKKFQAMVLGIFLVIALAIYGPALDNQLFWDDDDVITNNYYIKDWSAWPQFFTENLIAGAGQVSNYWRPVLLLSFSLDYQLWGLEPFGYHLTNVFWHVLAAWLVFLLLIRLTGKRVFLSFAAALLFLVHPLQTEAVIYAAGRADPLSAVFSLAAILFYFDFRQAGAGRINWRDWRLTAALFSFVLALLTKEQTILVPALLALVEGFFFFKRSAWRQSLVVLSGFAGLTVIYLILRLTILDFNDLLAGVDYQPGYDSSVWVRLLTFAKVMVQYFGLLFFPFDLHMAREVAPVQSLFSWPAGAFLGAAAAIGWLSAKTWSRQRLIAFGWLWFFLILSLRTNLIQINRPMYEHWLYLPMLGFWLACLLLLANLWQALSAKFKLRSAWFQRLAWLSLGLAAAYFGILSGMRNLEWRDPITFYERNLRFTPHSYIQRNNLAMAYSARGRHEEAAAEYRRSLELADIYPQVHSNLANSLLALGQAEAAIAEYEKAIEISPEFIIPYQYLLQIHLTAGNKAAAEAVLAQAEASLARRTDFLALAGDYYLAVGDRQRALNAFEEWLEIDFSPELLAEVNSLKR